MGNFIPFPSGSKIGSNKGNKQTLKYYIKHIYIKKCNDINFFSADSDTTDEVIVVKKIKIHCSRLNHELVEVFQDPVILIFSICVTVIDQRGNEEEGIGDGVMRDVICTFLSNLAHSHWIGLFQIILTAALFGAESISVD